MAIRNIREMGDPVLNKVCKEVKEVTPRTLELIQDMVETMYEANGVGLAAPQVGILKRMGSNVPEYLWQYGSNGNFLLTHTSYS